MIDKYDNVVKDRTPCCGYPTMTAGGYNPISWDTDTQSVKCHECGMVYRMMKAEDQHIEGDESFRLLALSETLKQLAENIDGKMGNSAAIHYLQACSDATDPGEDAERRALRGAMDVLEDIWGRR